MHSLFGTARWSNAEPFDPKSDKLTTTPPPPVCDLVCDQIHDLLAESSVALSYLCCVRVGAVHVVNLDIRIDKPFDPRYNDLNDPFTVNLTIAICDAVRNCNVWGCTERMIDRWSCITGRPSLSHVCLSRRQAFARWRQLGAAVST